MSGEPLCPFLDCLEPVFAVDESVDPPVGWCVEHFPLVIERLEAIAANPGLRETLPPLYEHVV